MRIVVNGLTKKRSSTLGAAEAVVRVVILGAVAVAAVATSLVFAAGSVSWRPAAGPTCGETRVVSWAVGAGADLNAAVTGSEGEEAQGQADESRQQDRTRQAQQTQAEPQTKTQSEAQSQAQAKPQQTQPQTQPQAQAQPPAAESVRDAFIKAYRIGPGDLLEVKVFEIDQLNQTVRVSEDGAITLPLIGRVEVGGLTQDGIVRKLTDLLKAKYVKDPQVTIFIKEYKSNQVAVIGAVKEPGSYELVGRKNLLQVISMAGGFTESAMDIIYVLRQSDGAGAAARTIPIDLRELVVKGNQELNIPIEPNDVVNVPIDKEIRVFVMGRVNKPGAVRFKLSENASLLQAIADAGGFAEGARRGAVVITRKDKSGKERKIRVNIKDILSGKKKDIALEEGDVIFVPESFW